MAHPRAATIDSELAVEGDLRLVDRVDINGFATGALQVFVDGAFGAVCSSRFSHEEAGVACRQMGFVSGRAIRDTPFVLDSRNPRRTSPVNRDALRVRTPALTQFCTSSESL